MNRRIAALLLFTLLSMALLTSCASDSPTESPTGIAGALTQAYKEDSETEDLDAYMKRMVADTELNKKKTLAVDETYQISFPFTYEEISFQSDNPLVAAVSKEGLICGKSGGKAMVHAVVDGLWFHFLVTVDGVVDLNNTKDPYAAFSLSALDAEAAEKSIETYATVIGLSISSGLDTEENLKHSDTFAINSETDPCEIKYKLLTTVDYLQSNYYTSMDLKIESTEAGDIIFRFYATA